MGFFGVAVSGDATSKFQDSIKNCKVFDVTCRLVGLFLRKGMSKVDVRKAVQANIKQIKHEFGLDVLDTRLQAKVKDALALR